MRKTPVPTELTDWIGTVIEGRPRNEQEAAKSELAGWININIRVQDREVYRTFCMDRLVDALEEREQRGSV